MKKLTLILCTVILASCESTQQDTYYVNRYPYRAPARVVVANEKHVDVHTQTNQVNVTRVNTVPKPVVVNAGRTKPIVVNSVTTTAVTTTLPARRSFNHAASVPAATTSAPPSTHPVLERATASSSAPPSTFHQ